MGSIGKIALIAAVALLPALLPMKASAINDPAKIDWKAVSAQDFVASLYVGVLGRDPAARDAVADWESQITSDEQTRFNVFNKFLGQPEYLRRNPRGIKGTYVLWEAACPTGTSASSRYRIAPTKPVGEWRAQNELRWSWAYARAVMGYKLLFPTRRCR